MKSLFKMLALLMLAVSLLTCTQEGDVNPVNVQFTFDLKSPDDSGGRTSSFDLPEGMSLLVSIEKSSGEIVFTHHTITLLRVGGRYITEPLLLNPGTYRLTDFMLVNESSQVLYATPRKGSPLAGAVGNPLPHVFIVSKNNTSELEMGVVDVTRSTPEEFGYTTFDIDLISAVRVGVFVDEDDDVSLTTAQAYILKRRDIIYFDTLQSFDLGATINILPLTADPDDEIILVVTKDTYRTYWREVALHDLLDELNNQPLSIVLQPVITFVAHDMDNSQEYSLYFEVGFENTSPLHFEVNWGDGSGLMEYTIASNQYSWNPAHVYWDGTPGDYTVTISGDLFKIVTLSITPTDGGPNATSMVDIRHLPSLATLTIANTTGPRTLDLSKNPKLNWLQLQDTDIETFDIAANPKLEYLTLEHCPNITTERVDSIIHSLYNNVVAHNVIDGSAFLRRGYGDEGQYFIGPPSAESVAKLRILKNDYNWSVYPDPH